MLEFSLVSLEGGNQCCFLPLFYQLPIYLSTSCTFLSRNLSNSPNTFPPPPPNPQSDRHNPSSGKTLQKLQRFVLNRALPAPPRSRRNDLGHTAVSQPKDHEDFNKTVPASLVGLSVNSTQCLVNLLNSISLPRLRWEKCNSAIPCGWWNNVFYKFSLLLLLVCLWRGLGGGEGMKRGFEWESL